MDVRTSSVFDADFSRLARWDASLARELADLIHDELGPSGCVPDGYGPHVLRRPGGCYNGCVEFHLANDVLVLYRAGHGFVRLVRICTHAELAACRFGSEWPRA